MTQVRLQGDTQAVDLPATQCPDGRAVSNVGGLGVVASISLQQRARARSSPEDVVVVCRLSWRGSRTDRRCEMSVRHVGCVLVCVCSHTWDVSDNIARKH